MLSRTNGGGMSPTRETTHNHNEALVVYSNSFNLSWRKEEEEEEEEEEEDEEEDDPSGGGQW
jgi:hypothetical protein